MLPARVLSLFAAAAVVTTFTAACGPSNQPEPAAPAALHGVFRPKVAGEGAAIGEIEFRDTHYRLLTNGCTDASCEEQGTFTHDRVAHRLDLVVDKTGKSYSLSFGVLATRKAASEPSTTLKVRSEGPTVTPGAGKLLEEQDEPLVTSATLVGHEYSLFEEDPDGCDNSGLWPRIWESELCGGVSRTFGFAHCYVKTSGCQSTGRSCLDDNGNGRRWDDRASQCRELGGTGFESQGSGISVAYACCKPR